MHLHHELLISVPEEAPEHAIAVPDQEWAHEKDLCASADEPALPGPSWLEAQGDAARLLRDGVS